MRRHRSARPIHAVLALLAGGTGLGVVTAVLWAFAPEQVRALDRALVEAHSARARRALSAAEALRDAGSPEQAQAGFEALAADLDWVQRGDRLAPVRSEALRAGSELALAAGRPERAVEHSAELLALSDRELRNLLLHGSALRAAGEEARAHDLLLGLQQRAPQWLPGTEALLDLLQEQDRWQEMAAALERYARAPQPGIWFVYYQFAPSPQGFSLPQRELLRPWFRADDRLEAQVELPAETRYVNVSPPGRAWLRLGDPVLEVRSLSTGRSARVDLLRAEGIVAGQLTRIGDSFETAASPYPHLVAPIPTDLGEGPYAVRFHTRFAQLLPSSLAERLLQPGIANLQTRGELSAEQRLSLRALRRRAWLSTRPFRDAQGAPHFAWPTARAQDEAGLRFRLPGGAPNRLQVPQAPGLQVRFDAQTKTGSVR